MNPFSEVRSLARQLPHRVARLKPLASANPGVMGPIQDVSQPPVSAMRSFDDAAPSPVPAEPVMGFISPQEEYREKMQRFHSMIDNLSNAEIAAADPNDTNYRDNLRDIRAGAETAKYLLPDRLAATDLAMREYQRENPWGSPGNHPGFWGKAAHVMGRIGDIAGTAFAPGVMGMIPGTALNRQLRENQDVAQLEKGQQLETESEKAQTQAAQERSEEPLRAAQAKEATQEAALAGEKSTLLHNAVTALSDPNALQGFETQLGKMTPDEQAVMQGAFQQAKMSGTFAPLTSAIDRIFSERAIAGRAHLQHVAGMLNGKMAYANYNPGTGQYYDEAGNLLVNFQPLPTFGSALQQGQYGLWQPTMLNQNGKLVPGMMNMRTGETRLAEAPGGGAIIPKDVQGEINKALQIPLSADTRYRVMVDNEKPALEGNQQAMLNVLANHIGMTMGLQKGARITQAVWDEARETAPWLERIAARFDKNGYLSGVTLTPEQIKQMVDLGYDRRIREWQQAEETAKQYGLDITGQIPEDVKQSLGGLGPIEARGQIGPPRGNAPSETGTVTMVGPDGKDYRVPQDKVQQALKDGLRRK